MEQAGPTNSASYQNLIFAGGLLLFGCGSPAGPVVGADPCVRAREIRTSNGFLGVAEEADVVARVVAGGFGSLFQDFGNTNALIIHIQDPAKTDSAETAVRRLLDCGAAYPGWADSLVDPAVIYARPGQFTGSQLLAYLGALAPLKNDAAVWGLEVDAETAKIWIGLRDGSEVVRIAQLVAAASVPSTAVDIEPPPPVTGLEPFQVLDSPIIPVISGSTNGVFLAETRVQYTNRFPETRYPDNCITVDGSRVSFLYRIEKWDGQSWRAIHDPICRSVALAPRPVLPGESRTDTIPFVGVRRLRSAPWWRAARITGTYRFVGTVYLSTTPNPPFLANPAPEAQNSTPFRITNSLPF